MTNMERSRLPARPLPDDVRQIVDEIETEIGEAPEGIVETDALVAPGRAAAVESIEGAADRGHSDGRVEAAVREILDEIGDGDGMGREGLWSEAA